MIHILNINIKVQHYTNLVEGTDYGDDDYDDEGDGKAFCYSFIVCSFSLRFCSGELLQLSGELLQLSGVLLPFYYA